MSYQLGNNLYKYLKPFLFRLNPEVSHSLALKLLNLTPKSFFYTPKKINLSCMGIQFNNRYGLAAGLDKNAQYIDALSKLGFSFIEVGTVTPKPQVGNDKPRLFRYPKFKALVNRMGFNNCGIDNLVHNVKNSNYEGILGINIGKNKDTSLENAHLDYTICMQKAYKYASYITINISSPNTKDLRTLQNSKYLQNLLAYMSVERKLCEDRTGKYVPLLIKISPDEKIDDLRSMLDIILGNKLDGIIATNTTVYKPKPIIEAGGLSGLPLTNISTNTIKLIRSHVGRDFTIIASGGIMNADIAIDKINAGANLIQLYTGLIYDGPKLIYDIDRAL